MKVLKKAQQKNVLLRKDFYNWYTIKKMLENKEVCFFNDYIEDCYDYDEYLLESDGVLRIFLEKGDELKIELNDGMYVNVLVKEDGKKYFIEL